MRSVIHNPWIPEPVVREITPHNQARDATRRVNSDRDEADTGHW